MNRYKSIGYSVIEHLNRSAEPTIKTVKTDEMTDMANECFDMPFDGQCKFYPFEMPNNIGKFNTLVITGRSGSGKSTLLKYFAQTQETSQYVENEYVPMAFLRCGIWPDDFQERIESVGLDIDRIITKKYAYLSEGEKFRANVALQLADGAVFDEFTSMVDRSIARTVCEGISRYISEHNLSGIVLCSCHKDFIEWIRPDYIIDLDDSAVYSKSDNLETEDSFEESELIGSFVL